MSGPPVVAIVGPTASGKSSLALRLATSAGGEVVSADSRQVYRGMDIGTAKPAPEELARVRHHLIDVVDPDVPYNVARYQRDARSVLEDLARRGVRAIVVGGTGLYVRALLDGLALSDLPRDPALREALELHAKREGPAAMHARLAAIDPLAAQRVDQRNVRRVVRYLEVATLAGSASALWRQDAAVPALKIGLRPPRDVLAQRIEVRVREMVARGVLQETARLLERYPDPLPASLTAHGYPHWAKHLRGEIGLEKAIVLTVRDTKAYSKRQMTWFRRDPAIRWYDPTSEDPLVALGDAVAQAPGL